MRSHSALIFKYIVWPTPSLFLYFFVSLSTYLLTTLSRPRLMYSLKSPQARTTHWCSIQMLPSLHTWGPALWKPRSLSLSFSPPRFLHPSTYPLVSLSLCLSLSVSVFVCCYISLTPSLHSHGLSLSLHIFPSARKASLLKSQKPWSEP